MSRSFKSPIDVGLITCDTQTYVGVAVPAAPASGLLTTYSENVGGRQMLSQIGPSGIAVNFQTHLGRGHKSRLVPQGNATTIDGETVSGTGTTTSANVATTNLHTIMKRVEWLVTVASTSAVAGFRLAANQFCRGNAAKIGGFHYVVRWGPATGVATATNRAFVGLTNSTIAPTDVQPSSLTDMIGMGWDAADTNIQMMTNDASGTATKTDLGASFPVPTVDRTSVYEIIMFCAPNNGSVYWQITNLVSDAVATGTISADLPASTTMLSPRGWMSVGGTSSVIGFALMGQYIETDY